MGAVTAISDRQGFMEVFAGNTDGHGQTTVGEIVNGKAEAKCITVMERPQFLDYDLHLQGQVGLGISPLRADGTVRFCAIDIDSYSYDLMDIVRAIWDFDLPLFPCWSKSHKLHIYIFFSDDTPAKEAVELCQWYRSAFACEPKTEIFPKQTKVTAVTKFPSWINLPYFGDTDRKCVKPDGSLLPLDKFISLVEEKRISIKEHWALLKELDFYEAPPCLLSGILLRDIGPGKRNNWLFSVAVFYRNMDEHCDWETRIVEINHSLKEPVPDKELESTVIKSMQERSYNYLCGQLDRCQRTLCEHKEFGVKSTSNVGLDFGQLIRITTDPPMYKWNVSGKVLFFKDVSELLSQSKFKQAVANNINMVPRVVSDEKWSGILSRALSTVIEESPGKDDDVSGDFTQGSILYDEISAFLVTKRRAQSLAQIFIGRVYDDNSTQSYVFSSKELIKYLNTVDGLSRPDPLEVRRQLVENMGAYKMGSTWHVPYTKVSSAMKPGDIDFATEADVDTLF